MCYKRTNHTTAEHQDNYKSSRNRNESSYNSTEGRNVMVNDNTNAKKTSKKTSLKASFQKAMKKENKLKANMQQEYENEESANLMHEYEQDMDYLNLYEINKTTRNNR